MGFKRALLNLFFSCFYVCSQVFTLNHCLNQVHIDEIILCRTHGSCLLLPCFPAYWVYRIHDPCYFILLDADMDESIEDHETFTKDRTCNEDCFQELWRNFSSGQQMSYSNRKRQCHSLHAVSSAYMYSRLCRNVLSDLGEHRQVADKGGKKYRKHRCCCSLNSMLVLVLSKKFLRN